MHSYAPLDVPVPERRVEHVAVDRAPPRPALLAPVPYKTPSNNPWVGVNSISFGSPRTAHVASGANGFA